MINFEATKCGACKNGVEFRHKPYGNNVKWPSPLFSLPPPLITAKGTPNTRQKRIRIKRVKSCTYTCATPPQILTHPNLKYGTPKKKDGINPDNDHTPKTENQTGVNFITWCTYAHQYLFDRTLSRLYKVGFESILLRI